MTCTPESGTCTKCVNACRTKPGWFRPGEPEKAAALLGIPLQEFFDTKLGVDWWEADAGLPLTFVIAPATTSMLPGREYPVNPRGTCVFLDDHDRCSIHEAKPSECAAYWCETKAKPKEVHEAITKDWLAHQDDVVNLLGGEPEPAEIESIWDLMGLLEG